MPALHAQTPAAPTAFSATAAATSITLTWTSVSGATGYKIYRGTTAGGESTTALASPTASPYTDSGLTAGTTYYYKVAAANGSGTGTKSGEASATPGSSALAAPGTIKAVPASTQVSVSWSAVSGATSYNLFRSTGGAPALYKTGLTASGIEGTFVDTGLTNGTTYSYQVAAVSAAGQGGLSDTASATPGATVLSPPAHVALSPSASAIYVSWMNVSGATSYNIYRSTTSGGEGNAPYVDGNTSGNYNDHPLTSGQAYYYQVTAVNADGESAKSAEVMAHPGDAVPTAPTVTVNGQTSQVVVNWTTVTGAASYNVYRGTSQTKQLLYSFGPSGSTYTDTSVSNGTIYYYTVAATNSAGEEGAFATLVSATPLAVPAGLAATATSGQVSVSWGQVTGATGYKLERSTNGGSTWSTVATPSDPTVTYTDTAVTVGSSYSYRVSATAANSQSSTSGVMSATVPPNAPTSLSATAATSQVTLSWTASSGATSYNLYRSTTSGGEGSTPYVTGVTSPKVDTGVTNGTTYYYQVTAVGTGGESNKSNEASATPQPALFSVSVSPTSVIGGASSSGTVTLNSAAGAGGVVVTLSDDSSSATSPGSATVPAGSATGSFTVTTSTVSASTTVTITAVAGGVTKTATLTLAPPSVPSAPTGLTATAVSNTQINLTWTASSGATGYKVERSPNGTSGWAQVGTSSSASFSDTGLSALTLYYYRVRATNAGGDSGYSGTVSATTLPSAPTGLTAQPGNTQVSLSWGQVTGATGYNLYRSTTAGGEGTTPYKTGLSSRSYKDTGLTNSTTYYYQVTAVASSGESLHSNEASATPLSTLPVSPSGVTATAGDAQVSVSWSAVSGATSYNLYQSTASGAEGTTPYHTNVTSTSVDTGLTNGTKYYYQVTALNANGESAHSSEVSATPQSAVIALSTVSVSPTSVVGGTGSTVTVTLTGTAGTGGVTVSLSSTASATVPATQTVAAGQFSVAFPITTSAVSTTTTVTITATYNSVSKTATLTLTPAPPSAPTGLSATAGVGQIGLSWTAVSGATSYSLYRSTTSGGEGSTPYQTGLTGTSYTDSSVTAGTTYYYKLTATGTGGEGSASGEASATPIPAAPTGLSATAGAGQVSLIWTASAGATSYRLYRGTSAGAEVATPVQTGLTGTAYTDTGLTNGTTYYYKLTAVNTGGESSKSNEASAMPHYAVGSLVLYPNTVTSGTGSQGTVTLNGTVIGSDVTVTLSSDNAAATVPAGGNVVVTAGNASATFPITTSVVTTTATVHITAMLGTSSQSSTLTVQPPAVPAAPTNLAALITTSTQVNLTWMASSGATSYKVERSPDGSTSWSQIGTTTTAVAFTDNGFVLGQPFAYRIRATGPGGTSDPSNVAFATTDPAVRPLSVTDIYLPKTIQVQCPAVFGYAADNSDPNHQHMYVWDRTGTPNGSYGAADPVWLDTFEFAFGSTYHYHVRAHAWGSNYEVVDPATNRYDWVLYDIWQDLGTITVVPEQTIPTDNEAVDSRLDPRYSTNHLLNHKFGSMIYRGGLYAGYIGDPSQVGRSFLKFQLPALTTGQHAWPAGSVNGYATRSFGTGTTIIGCVRVSDAWDSASLVWSNAPPITFGTIPPPVTATITYDATSPLSQWVHWSMPLDIATAWTGNGSLAFGLASTNEAASGWVYFAKKEYNAAQASCILYALGASQ